MNWATIKKEIYYCDGSWRDIYILDTSIEDWKKWVDFINTKYNPIWYNPDSEISQNQINLDVILQFKEIGIGSSTSFFVGKIEIKCHFFSWDMIENDFDPEEILSESDHFEIINYMKNVSKILEKPVILTPENQEEFSYISILNDKIELNSKLFSAK